MLLLRLTGSQMSMGLTQGGRSSSLPVIRDLSTLFYASSLFKLSCQLSSRSIKFLSSPRCQLHLRPHASWPNESTAVLSLDLLEELDGDKWTSPLLTDGLLRAYYEWHRRRTWRRADHINYLSRFHLRSLRLSSLHLDLWLIPNTWTSVDV